MSPRPYRQGRRAKAAEETRSRILKAAWQLLAPGADVTEFSLEAVARRAGVARMTVYYQFGSKRGLLEALFDWFAARGKIAEHIGGAFQREDPLEALDQLVAAFGQFWGASRVPIRRVRALAALDAELEQAVEERNQRRREALRAMVGRLSRQRGAPPADAADQTIEMLYAVTSFETFDTLAGSAKKLQDVVPLVQKLARAAVTVT